MVCQAASQTRFRALKHESGTTIIVRVIACFQPLQDCQVRMNKVRYNNYFDPCLSFFFEDADEFSCVHFQAEYFRHLLKPVT